MKPATFQLRNQNNINDKERSNRKNEKEERSNRKNEKEEYKNVYSIKPLKVAENVYYLQK